MSKPMSYLPFAILCCFVALAVPSSAFAQQSKAAAQPPALAPIPAAIRSAKKVFISNIGADAPSWQFFSYTEMPNEPYQSFYTAMKTWGHFELVDDPSQADLVAEIHFRLYEQSPALGLSLIDAHTHFTEWTLLQPVNGAFRKATWRKNYLAGVNNLMQQLEEITAP